MNTSGLVIAFEQGKEGFVELNPLGGSPVFMHVVRNMGEVAEEVALVVSEDSEGVFIRVASEHGFDKHNVLELNCQSDVFRILKESMMMVRGEIVVAAPANAPLIPVDILALLAELCEKRDAVLVRDAKGEIDWLLSAYNRRSFIQTVEAKGSGTLDEVVNELRRVMCMSYSTLKDLDPMLFSTVRITRASEIPSVERIFKRMGRGVK